MTITSGFYNSLNHDRRYDAFQFGSMFDGLIHDGIYMNIGQKFEVKVLEGTKVTVGTGRCWFDRSWLLNDTLYTIDCGVSDVLRDRYDAIVIETNSTDAVRLNTIKVIHGTPSSSPSRPSLTKVDGIHQYPLAYIYRKAGVETLVQANISNMVGTSECPFVTGIVQSMNLDLFIRQMESQWDYWFARETDENNNEMAQWINEKQGEFVDWFGSIQAMLDGDVALNLTKAVVDLNKRFDILALEKAVYTTIDDSDGGAIKDNNGSDILGRTFFEPKHIFDGKDIYDKA